MNVLALDLATKTGWCQYSEGYWRYGILTLTGRSHGERFWALWGWLRRELEAAEPDVIAFEHAMISRGGRTADFLAGLAAVVQLAAELAEITYVGVHTGTLKRHATGDGRADKQAMVRRASEIVGADITSDDEADAICLADYVLSGALELGAATPGG